MNQKNYFLLVKENYPLLLKHSIYCPNKLYAMGNLPKAIDDNTNKNTFVGIAMVGTRRPGNNAKELCYRLVKSLKNTQAVIISGLAQGIDSFCHEAALELGLPTIAVLAQGLNVKIEGSRGILAKKIIDNGGGLVSEFNPDTIGFKGNFPARNKIISGISHLTIIIQSKEKGGALITGEFTRNENKPLYAIPGDFDSEVSSGTNNLLDLHLAKPIFKPESLPQVLGIPTKKGQNLKEIEKYGCYLSEKAKKIFLKNNGFRKTFDELKSDFIFDTHELLTILTELEIAGIVHSDDNYHFYFNGVTK